MFVLMMVVGSVACFLLFDTWNKLNPDERELPHDYILTGEYKGEGATGTGMSEYCDETALGRLFNFNLEIHTATEHVTFHFGFAFDLNDSPLSNLYRHTGSIEGSGETLEIWEYTENGVDYTMHVGTLCKVKQFVIHSSDLNLVGELSDR